MDKLGTVLPQRSLIMRRHVCDAESPTGEKYEGSLTAGAGLPCVKSYKTGQWWLIGWDQLIDLAIAAGIDKPAIEIDLREILNHQPAGGVSNHGA